MPKRRKLLRLIVPAYPRFNIYTAMASRTTGLGLILVGSAANKLIGWEVEIIDENNCKRRVWPGNAEDGYVDHRALQTQRPADIVGFFGSMSSSVPRLCELAKLYQELGAVTVTGGYHARALPQDMLDHNIDIVAMQDGEQPIIEILNAFDEYSEQLFSQSSGVGTKTLDYYFHNISDVSFMSQGKIVRTKPLIKTEDQCDNCVPWPLPDFGLLRYAKLSTYPIIWRKGCPYNCEFCAVKDRPESVPAEEFMARLEYMVDKFKAKNFFIVDDHFGGSLNNPDDYAETMKLLRLMQEYQKRIGKRLSFTIQIRLNMSEKTELILEMRKAGIDLVCIGIESPIDGELKAMNKGYESADMVKWVKLWRDQGFFVHGMMIFSYPKDPNEVYEDDEGNPLPEYSVAERAQIYRDFIKQSNLDTAQVLLTVPIPGTELWNRLEKEGRLLPGMSWELWDGQYPLYQPDNATPEELQDAMHGIMGNFYGFRHVVKLFFLKWCIRYPLNVFPYIVTLATLRTRYLVKAHKNWSVKHHRNTLIRAGGWFVVKHWEKQLKKGDFRAKLKRAQEALKKRGFPPSGF